MLQLRAELTTLYVMLLHARGGLLCHLHFLVGNSPGDSNPIDMSRAHCPFLPRAP